MHGPAAGINRSRIRLIEPPSNAGLSILVASIPLVGVSESHKKFGGDKWMRNLKDLGPITVLSRQSSFLLPPFATPMRPSRVVNANARTIHQRLGLNLLHHIAH